MAIISAITGVFTEIGTWIAGAFTDLIPVFWNATDSQLTFMGVLAVCGLAFSVIFLNQVLVMGHNTSDRICESA